MVVSGPAPLRAPSPEPESVNQEPVAPKSPAPESAAPKSAAPESAAPQSAGQELVARAVTAQPAHRIASTSTRPWLADLAAADVRQVRADAYPTTVSARDTARRRSAAAHGRELPLWPVAAVAAAMVVVGLVWLLPGILATTSAPDARPPAGAVAANPTASARVSAPPSPNVVAGTSPRPTEQAGDPMLPPTRAGTPGRLETAVQRLAVWEDPFGAVRAEVVVTVRNTGGSPVEVALSTATWTVSDEAGQPVASGRFAHAFPSVVEPGGKAYLVDGVSAAFAEVEELATLEVDVQGLPAGGADAPVKLEVADVKWTPTDDGGVAASGRVENPSTEPVSEASAAVLLMNESDEILAAVYDVAIGPLGPGESRTFDTAYPGTPPVDPDDVVSAEAVATGDRRGSAEAE